MSRLPRLDEMQATDLVHEFRRAIRGEVPPRPTLDVPYRELHIALIEEELDELRTAMAADNLVEVADALADLLYVTYEAAFAFGIPIDDVFAEVHRANMAKVGPRGELTVRPDGKVVAPPGWRRRDVAGILARHGAPPG